MSFKTFVAVVALTAGVASATPFAKRQSTGSVNFVNQISETIPFSLVGENGVVTSGTFTPGSTTSLPMSPDMAGYSLKLAAPGGDPSASTGVIQYEYTYTSGDNGTVYYELSDVNGPDPYTAYTRTITPTHIGSRSNCQVESCQAGEDSDSCEFIGGALGDGGPDSCADFDGVVLTFSIST